MATRRRIVMSESLPVALRDAALRYATDPDTDDLALRLFEAFGIARVGDEAHRRAAWLCVLATRKVLYGWVALECKGDGPARAVEAVARWVQAGVPPRNWRPLCEPARAVRDGREIRDCDACRAQPIAAAAARTARFARSPHLSDAAEALFEVWCAIDEGIHGPGEIPFEEWVAVVALPAAYELRSLTECELRGNKRGRESI
jgi:hypothetical protein